MNRFFKLMGVFSLMTMVSFGASYACSCASGYHCTQHTYTPAGKVCTKCSNNYGCGEGGNGN